MFTPSFWCRKLGHKRPYGSLGHAICDRCCEPIPPPAWTAGTFAGPTNEARAEARLIRQQIQARIEAKGTPGTPIIKPRPEPHVTHTVSNRIH